MLFIFSMLVQFSGWSNQYGPCCTLKNEEPTNSGTVVQKARENIWSQVSATAQMFSQKTLTNPSSLKVREAQIIILMDSFWVSPDFLSFNLTVSYVLCSCSQRKEVKKKENSCKSNKKMRGKQYSQQTKSKGNFCAFLIRSQLQLGRTKDFKAHSTLHGVCIHHKAR